MESRAIYNANGEPVAMMGWNGTVNFELDILDRIISANDHNEQVTSYTYDAVGNQTSMTYPDGTVAKYEYDLLGRMTSLTDAKLCFARRPLFLTLTVLLLFPCP